MRTMQIDQGHALALCEDDGGARHTVDLTLLGDVEPGDVVLVHAGVAIATLASGSR